MLEGRVALVTGGGRGIGGATTRALAQDGAHVAAGYSRDLQSVANLAADLRDRGLSVSHHQGKVGVPDDCYLVANEVLDTYGRIDILVNYAGVNVDKTVRKMTI